MKKVILSVLVMLCIIPSAQIMAGVSSAGATVAAINAAQRRNQNNNRQRVQRVCRLQIVRINGQRVVQDRVTGRILINANRLQRNRNNVLFLNGNRVVVNALRTAALLNGRVVVIGY